MVTALSLCKQFWNVQLKAVVPGKPQVAQGGMGSECPAQCLCNNIVMYLLSSQHPHHVQEHQTSSTLAAEDTSAVMGVGSHRAISDLSARQIIALLKTLQALNMLYASAWNKQQQKTVYDILYDRLILLMVGSERRDCRDETIVHTIEETMEFLSTTPQPPPQCQHDGGSRWMDACVRRLAGAAPEKGKQIEPGSHECTGSAPLPIGQLPPIAVYNIFMLLSSYPPTVQACQHVFSSPDGRSGSEHLFHHITCISTLIFHIVARRDAYDRQLLTNLIHAMAVHLHYHRAVPAAAAGENEMWQLVEYLQLMKGGFAVAPPWEPNEANGQLMEWLLSLSKELIHRQGKQGLLAQIFQDIFRQLYSSNAGQPPHHTQLLHQKLNNSEFVAQLKHQGQRLNIQPPPQLRHQPVTETARGATASDAERRRLTVAEESRRRLEEQSIITALQVQQRQHRQTPQRSDALDTSSREKKKKKDFNLQQAMWGDLD